MTRARIYLSFVLILLFALACVMPEIPMDDDTFNTAVAQTVKAGLTEKYVSPTFTSSPTITLTPSHTPVPPTETPTPPATITPTFPPTLTVTNTIEIPPQKIIVVVNTNCRTGPDTSFKVEGTLLKGESATVHGIDPTGSFYYIRNPDPGIDYCWMSGKHAVVGGSTALLPVLTAMPTFTATSTTTAVPSFHPTYYKVEYCGSFWFNLELQNGGEATFNSVLIKVKEQVKGNTFWKQSNDFTYKEGCDNPPVVEENLPPGKTVLVSSDAIPYNVLDTRVEATITVCTEEDLKGDCLSKTLSFMP